MKKMMAAIVAVLCLVGFNSMVFADEMGKMKGEIKSEKGEMKDKMGDEMKSKKDEMKGKMGDEMKSKKGEMKGKMGEMGK